jgi:2',3'-cyclic-nucleotide 2'-phosphodiesterase (5'-nucleotidase family)
MARWAALLENKREERPVLLIDAGDFCAVGKLRDKEIKNEYFFKALEMLRYDALGVAENEILFGRKNLEGMARKCKLALLSANILDRKSGRPIFGRHLIKRTGGSRFLFLRSGGVRVGVFSVSDPELIYSSDRLVRNYYEIIDPRIAALDAVSTLREKGCDIIVALSHQEWNKSVDLAREVPGVDIVVTSHSSMSAARSEDIEGVLVVAPGNNTTSFTEIEVSWAESGTRMSVIDWGKDLLKMKDHPEFLELEEEFKKATGKTGEIKLIK